MPGATFLFQKTSSDQIVIPSLIETDPYLQLTVQVGAVDSDIILQVAVLSQTQTSSRRLLQNM